MCLSSRQKYALTMQATFVKQNLLYCIVLLEKFKEGTCELRRRRHLPVQESIDIFPDEEVYKLWQAEISKESYAFCTILDHNFYSLTEVMMYQRLVYKKRCCTRKPRYKICRWRDVECCVICGLPSPPTSIYLHDLNSDYFPIRFAFPNQTARQISSIVPKKVILVVQYSPRSKISTSIYKIISKTHPYPG